VAAGRGGDPAMITWRGPTNQRVVKDRARDFGQGRKHIERPRSGAAGGLIGRSECGNPGSALVAGARSTRQRRQQQHATRDSVRAVTLRRTRGYRNGGPRRTVLQASSRALDAAWRDMLRAVSRRPVRYVTGVAGDGVRNVTVCLTAFRMRAGP